MIYTIFLLISICCSSSAMEQDVSPLVVQSDIKDEQKIIDSFMRHVATANLPLVTWYIANKLSPSALNTCIKTKLIDVNGMVNQACGGAWRCVALEAGNRENFAVIAQALGPNNIQYALNDAILIGKPDYIAACLQNKCLGPVLNFDHRAYNADKIVRKIVAYPTADLARLMVPRLRPRDAIAVLAEVFRVTRQQGLTARYKEMIQISFAQASLTNMLGARDADMVIELWNNYVQAKMTRIDIDLYKVDEGLRQCNEPGIQQQKNELTEEKARWQELMFIQEDTSESEGADCWVTL